tara:strand:- start:111 stop:503 length:393 start_codon:yes stop_codon:yes gene_type:complete
MNKPTPFGKKTFAEYEKEVNDYKEYNLSKVERVELASIKDFDKLAKESLKTVRATDKLVDGIKAQAKKALTELNKTGTLLVKVYPVYQDLERQAKELGVDLPKELSQEMNIIRSYIKSVDEDIKILKAII